MRPLVAVTVAFSALSLAGCKQLQDSFNKNLKETRRQARRDTDMRKESAFAMKDAFAGCPVERRIPYELDAEQEYYVGRACAAQQLESYGADILPAEDPLSLYVAKVGRFLALTSEVHGQSSAVDRADREERYVDNRPWPIAGYHFIVMKSDEAAAFAMPGGIVLVSTGLIAKLHSEDELAGVLAHEVAHVQRGHGVETMKAFMCQAAAAKKASEPVRAFGKHLEANARSTVPGAAIKGAQNQSVLAELLGGAVEGATAVFRAGYEPDFELEADRMAVRYLQAAGYSPEAYESLLGRFGASQPKGRYASTHPPFSDRVKTVRQAILKLPKERPTAEAVQARTARFASSTATPASVPPVEASAK